MALTAVQSKSIDAAEKYFSESLSVGDYYMGEAIRGTLHGKGTQILGLDEGGIVTSEAFKRLLRGHHPATNEQLAQRVRKDRRPCLDLTFSVPKSVSALYAVNEDHAILEAFGEAVKETMERDVEPLAARRVRSGEHAWSQQQQSTGNLLYAKFLHRTARPVDGKVDPHLHFHCIVFNHTTDDGTHYALEPEQIFRQRYSLQAKFEARLARKLKFNLGYDVERVSFRQSGKLKKGWEIKGIDRSTIEKFSRRTAEIEAKAKELGIKDPKKKEALSIDTREKKNATENFHDLRDEWRSRLDDRERQVFENLKKHTRKQGQQEDERAMAAEAVGYALDHHLYRASTVEKHTLIGTAAQHSLFLTPEQIEAALEAGHILHGKREERGIDRQLVTTLEVYKAEQRMIEFAKHSRGMRQAIARQPHPFKRTFLNDQQRAAVEHILTSRDTVMTVTGGAGTGKSSLLEEAAEGIAKGGKRMYAFAPTTGARDVLVEKGFTEAQTVEHLLRNPELQMKLKDQVLLIDEAALLDVRSMNSIFDVVEQQNARLILAGDTAQHNTVRRGEALRILEEHAGLQAVQVEKIQRQQGAYKRAIEMIGLGSEVIDHRTGLTGIVAGFDMLDRMGKIVEIDGEERLDKLAEEYLANSTQKSAPLVIAPSHAEGDELTARIRGQLMENQAIGRGRGFSILRSLHLSEAEKSQTSSYEEPGLVVQFHQNSTGFQRGNRYRVEQGNEGPQLKPLAGGPAKAIPLEHADRFEVYEQAEVELAKGDKIRFTLGGKAADGRRRISNGRVDEVSGFDRQGNIRLASGMTIAKEYGHLDHGYVHTSYASQGKQAKLAMAAIGSQSLPAVNAKQLYVTCSRGEEDVVIYVDDKEAVRRAIQNADEQLSATEMIEGQAAKARRRHRDISLHRRQLMERSREWWNKTFRSRHAGWSPVAAENRAVRHPSQPSSPQLGLG